MRASVIGLGAFGTALANTLASRSDDVQAWAREASVVESINGARENRTYLPGIAVSARVRATLSLEEALAGSELVVFATPSHATRDVVKKALPYLPEHVPLLTVAKGIENETLLTMTQLLEDCLPEQYHPSIAILSGPSFAKEMALGMPTVVTVASHFEKVAQKVQAALQTESFRTYTSIDVIGVEMGGALKNVIAIAAGISDGLGFGLNARSALITRGLAEISRIAVAMGANPLTLMGLSGLGDLVLTCTGDLSRNRQVGIELGKGRSLEQVLAGMTQVAEGVKTARSARDLSRKVGVELPICDQVHAIMYEGKSPRRAVVELMTRAPKRED
ncbi:MAG TPA: NAD(P)H-dependent glycerol-3-phosphate dehydrogenase [Myxococcaceae bacterium]|nr:NAD(P)H-dependent glycerol-3-phosphate dehydrogenase [Myxococcaceae bacterium]